MSSTALTDDRRQRIGAIPPRFSERVRQGRYRDAAYLDEQGCLVFHSEETYARYVESIGKRPGELNAIWVDEHGLHFRYSDDVLTSQEIAELEEAKRDLVAGKGAPWSQLRKELSLGE
ncbi:MAG: hypothetical protein AUJ92_21840 [Armatimonadetes bacterium CG2_30_59_28]|nr:hypothetical protein [Armatimonadota bacterium]OIO89293.1 MAG: hypothetical protein AUJ92_21840 [Armatimonadetes bacterium CG2_30_59_28]PIU62685.1 MAG: hypothetical protein COS85_17795 [Armatimonadetes bacterium CG07_land_8_20_14_0_80_59_28]PIX46008.1 MAG: hypothetical protein COZ56_00525 [Armatimonadetes bacterium CG_4_8_14_3_um_filter_58_9]PIY41952.1 MAG: hypothetical protein COZ05_14785 [Armatimonadetes bacterium CG_4_10_14_3_um_filter_59_10]